MLYKYIDTTCSKARLKKEIKLQLCSKKKKLKLKAKSNNKWNLQRRNDGMGNVCYRFKSQDNAQGSKKAFKQKEAVKVEGMSCVMPTSNGS